MTETTDSTELKPMTFDEYLDFLDEYWEMFGPPPPREPEFKADKMLF